MSALRVDIISDTHGHLSEALLQELSGADVIIHAGDIVQRRDLVILKEIAPVHAVLGNNDYAGSLGPEVEQDASFTLDSVRFYVKHIKPVFGKPAQADVYIYGHAHRAYAEEVDGHFEINPGSATWPRGGEDPSMARLWIQDGAARDAEIVRLVSS